MRFYRNSPFHSQTVGSLLAKLLAFILRFRKETKVIKNINKINYQLDLHQVIDVSLYFSGTFEEPEERIIESILKPGMTSLDVGANFGYHTFRMAQMVQPGGRVYAIEPTSWAYNKLIHNASLNEHLNNITFMKVGLSNEDSGRKELILQSSYRIDGRLADVCEDIILVKLDTLIKNHNVEKVDFIKLDVDGYEAKVICGGTSVLATFQPYILMEISPSNILMNGDDPKAMISILTSFGYKFETDRRVPIADLSTYYKKVSKNKSMMVFAIPPNKE